MCKSAVFHGIKIKEMRGGGGERENVKKEEDEIQPENPAGIINYSPNKRNSYLYIKCGWKANKWVKVTQAIFVCVPMQW